jgi:hypothetical protein
MAASSPHPVCSPATADILDPAAREGTGPGTGNCTPGPTSPIGRAGLAMTQAATTSVAWQRLLRPDNS